MALPGRARVPSERCSNETHVLRILFIPFLQLSGAEHDNGVGVNKKHFYLLLWVFLFGSSPKKSALIYSCSLECVPMRLFQNRITRNIRYLFSFRTYCRLGINGILFSAILLPMDNRMNDIAVL